jgi:hypothetical protein
MIVHGIVLPVVGETVGMVGTDELGPTVPVMGDTLAVGTAGAALTPRLLISVESNGIPARALPLVVVGDVDAGLDDAAILLEPEPHAPVNPDVSSIPEDVVSPDVAEIAVDVDIPGVAMLPEFVPVEGVVAPVAIPPPS